MPSSGDLNVIAPGSISRGLGGSSTLKGRPVGWRRSSEAAGGHVSCLSERHSGLLEVIVVTEGVMLDSVAAGGTVEAGLPVNVYVNRGKLVVVAPMPGLEPADIVVTIGGDTLAVHGEMRGELQEGKDYLVHEWHVGPYIRAIRLPFPVDGSRANVTYNNGILTVAVPEAAETVAHRIHLRRVSATSGEYTGFSGVGARSPGASRT